MVSAAASKLAKTDLNHEL